MLRLSFSVSVIYPGKDGSGMAVMAMLRQAQRYRNDLFGRKALTDPNPRLRPWVPLAPIPSSPLQEADSSLLTALGNCCTNRVHLVRETCPWRRLLTNPSGRRAPLPEVILESGCHRDGGPSSSAYSG